MKKRAGRSELRANHIAIAVAAAFAPWSAYGQTPPPNQLPALTLTQGSGQVNAPAGNFLQVDQYSQRAIFSGSMTMGSAGHMNVSQPGSSAIGLFRDVSGSLTQIFGRITANGQIFISNQNGVLFGSTARVEVGGLFASSLSINDSDFMEGRYNWYNDGSAGSVTNQGTIITPSGYTVLAGPQVRNDGLIVARTGTVALAAGDRVALDLIGDGLISVNVDQAALNASAVNTGTIEAEGGKVVLTARSASALLDTVVNAGGVIRASSLVERNGEIILDGGTTQITGTVDARNITVRGATISQAPSAAIIADTLTTQSTGNTTLTGTNQVGRFTGSSSTGSLTLIDGGALEVQGATTNNGGITLTTDSLTNAGLISNGGGASTANVILSADAFDLARGTVEGGAAAVIVRPRTGTRSFGIEAAGDTTLTNADIASINTSNFVVFGSGTGTIFTGNMTIGQNAQVDGGTKSLAFFRSSAPGGTTTIGSQGMTTTGDAIVSAGGGAIVSNGGTLAGDEIQLRASQGIGSAAARVRTNANALAINNTGGPGAFVSEGGDVTLRNVNLLVGGIANNVFNVVGGGGAYDVTAAGALSVGALGVGGLIATTNGAITLTTSSLANSGLITTNGPASTANIVFNADAFNLAGGTVQAGAGAVILRPRTGTNSFGIEAAGTTTLTNADIASIHTSDFVVFGSGMGTTFTGNMTIGANAQVNGGGKNLAFFRSSTPGGTTTIGPGGVSTTGDVIVSAGGGAIVSSGGTVSADEVQLRASQGIGSAAARVQTSANALAINNTGSQGAFVGEADSVTLRSINLLVGGLANNVANSVGAGGAYDVAANGALTVGGPISTLNGAITLNAGSLTNNSLITNGGGSSTATMIFNADAFNLAAGGTIEAGAAAVALRPRTGTNSFGIEAAGATTLSNADIASIQTDNFIIFGSSTGTVFTGNMTIGENARVEGNGKNLAFSRSLAPGAEMITIGTQGVATSGDVIIGAGGGGIRSNGGTVTGDEVVLRATNGIGTPSARVKTAANALALNQAGGGGVFVSELDNVTLRTISLNAGGPFTVSNTNNGSFSLISGGDVNVAGLVTSGGSMILDAGGNLKLDATSVDAELRSFGGQTISAQSINLVAENGRRAVMQNQGGLQELTTRSGGMDLQVAGAAGVAQIVNISSPFFLADQTIDVAGQLNVLGGATGGSTNSGIFQNGSGLQKVTADGITLQGASTGTNAGAGIRSQGDQLIDVGGDINLHGGNGGSNNNAFLSANPTTPGVVGKQTIYARDINVSNGVGGVDTSATITAGKQLIDVTGSVTLTAQGALLGTAPGGPGVRIGAPGGTPLGTDLTLLVDGSVTLNGGTVAENGASIGSSGATIPATPNTIRIEAGGNVMLNAGTRSGTGVRIGSGSSGTAGGDISVKAGGTIAMNGTARSAAIRTLDDVSLEAASISQAGDGFILASGLTTKSTAGSTILTGANQVSSFNGTSSGDLHLTNSGPLTVTGVDAAGNASLTNALGDVNLAGRWRSATASIASGGALIQTGGGFFQAGSLTTSSVGANLIGQNQVDVFNGTSAADLVFSNLAGFHISGARASGNASLFTAGAMTIGGAVEANVVTLHAGGGRIEEVTGGSIVASRLNAFATGDMTLNGANQIASLSATSFGTVSLGNSGLLSVLGMNATGDAAINDFGNVTLAGPWTAGGTSSITAGEILISGTMTSPRVVLNSVGSITQVGAGAVFANTLSTVSGGSTSLTGPNAVASYDGESGGTLTFNNSGALAISGLDAAGNAAVTSFGDLTLTGAWRSASADIRANGFGSAIRETGDGLVRAGSLTTFSEGTTSLTGANQVASFNGATSFGFNGDITLNNTGALTVTALATGGNATLTNNGGVSVTGAWSSSGATRIETAGGDLTVTTNTLRSNGTMDLDVGGRLVVSANGPQAAIVTGLAGQTVRAQGLEVTSQNGGFATLETQGDQRITVTGGSVDVQVLNGFGTAQIVGAPGRSQTIQVVDGDHINVNGRGGFAAIITAPTGTQEVSITGGGANEIRLGSSGATGFSQIVGGSQKVTAGTEGQSGSITIVGSSANGRFAGLSTQPTTGGTQSVSTSGVLRVTGGNASAQNLNAGLFHGGGGAQTVNAARIELVAGTAGSGNGAMIVSNGGNVPGNVAGAQTITVTGDIVMEGGAGGNANITGGSTRLQKIQAHNISMTNALASGTDSGAFILGGLQDIHATGNLMMTARGAAGNLPGLRVGGLSGNGSTSTNLTLTLGGDLILTGGTGNNGVGIGTTAAPPVGAVLSNNITIEARDVILTGGTGTASAVRIGASGAPGAPNFGGDIRITARDIKLNVDAPTGALPAAIRTLGNVTLDAASISEGANGIIVADTLTTFSDSSTNLGGANQIAVFNATSTGGNVRLANTGVLDVTGMSAFGDATINNIGNVTVSGPWTAGGTSTISVGSDILLNARMESRDVVLNANDGAIIQAETASIAAETLTTSSTGDTLLEGVNEVATFKASSAEGDISVRTRSPLLTLASMELPGELLIRHTGAVDVRGNVSALAHDIRATGNVTVGSADARSATLLYAPGDISIYTPGSILVRGSDTTAGASSAVLAGGALSFNAGDVTLLAGSAAFTPVVVRGANGVTMSVGNELNVAAGSGFMSPALLTSGRNIDLTIGEALRVDAGSGYLSLARVQTESRDGVIRLTFPNLTAGGYFVNGVEADNHHGQTGFFTDFKPAKVGSTLLLEYGD